MLNSSKIVMKRSSIDRASNWLVVFLMAILFIATVFCAISSEIYRRKYIINHWYLLKDELNFQTFIFSCMTFFIAFHNIIPISMLATLEIVGAFQSYMISHDSFMHSNMSGTNAIVNTSSVMEELGHVNYIFTDKTGTLTCNEMRLRQISIGEHSFKIKADSSWEDLSNTFEKNDAHAFGMFMINLLLCHGVIPEYGKAENDVAYQSSSPDETAIVTALAQLEYKFIERIQGGAIVEINGVRQSWKILTVLDFTSERKRMSLIAQSPDDEFYVFTKGADSVISERLSIKNDIIFEATLGYLDSFARCGLRTLCMAYKQLSKLEYEKIVSDLNKAYSEIEQREQYMEVVADQVERNLILLGATGIEDKLQSHVPETIASLKKANIKIWMLTGDKLETAINIGYSCSLLSRDMDIRVLSCDSLEDCKNKLETIKKKKNIQPVLNKKLRVNPNNRLNMALVVTGQDLNFAVDPTCRELFLDIAIFCESIICCRFSPIQKKMALMLIKESVEDTTTLAIGDGANDCPMIKAADVGVGIIGKEGMQAANNADFTIGEFSHLTRLLFVHGAESHRRTCNTIHFCYYKNMVFNTISFYYNYMNLFTSTVLFSKFHMALFNTFYSSLPPFCFGIFDQSCSLEAQCNVPYLYESTRKSSLFSFRRFFIWFLNGILHSCILFFSCYALCSKGVISLDGTPISTALFGNILFLHVLIVITAKACLGMRYWCWLSYIGISVGPITFLFLLTIASRRLPTKIWYEPEFLDCDILMYQSPLFWLSFGIPVLVLLPDFIFHSIRNTWFLPSSLFVTEMERQEQINWKLPDSIKSIQSKIDRSLEIKNIRTKRYFGFAFSVAEHIKIKNKRRELTTKMYLILEFLVTNRSYSEDTISSFGSPR
ncbi:hypothetical protein HZS_5798, partial [Henneguya salminicola]